MECIRCGRGEQLEEHHIIARKDGGSDDPENKEWRCRACHKYEHTRYALFGSLEYEKSRGQSDRIALRQHRLDVLDKLNTIELIRERGTYLSYWTDRSTRHLPRRIPTKEEAKQELQFSSLLDEAMERDNRFKPVVLTPSGKE